MLAAGTALFAIVAVVPTLAAVVAIYGLVADPDQIHTHLHGARAPSCRPTSSASSATSSSAQAKRSTGELGFQIATSVVLALYLGARLGASR